VTAGRRIAVLLGLADDEEVWEDTDNAPPVRREEAEGSTRHADDPSQASRDAFAVAHKGHSLTIRRAPSKPVSIAPQKKDDLRAAIDALRSGQSVIIDLSHVPSDLRYRMLDYISGGCSAMSARMEKVAVGVFLLDPTPTPRK